MLTPLLLPVWQANTVKWDDPPTEPTPAEIPAPIMPAENPAPMQAETPTQMPPKIPGNPAPPMTTDTPVPMPAESQLHPRSHNCCCIVS